MEVVQLDFYAALDPETRGVVQQRTGEIRALMRRAAQDIVEIGQKLIEVKRLLGHGRFGEWLGVEFDMSWQTAGRFMNVAERFTDIQQIVDFAPSALYLLAAPSTPTEAREEALQRAGDGERITYSTAQDIVEAHRDEQGIPIPVRFSEAVGEPNEYTPANWTSATNEWYTPTEYIEAARAVMGSIDFDPASNETAQGTIQAKYWCGLDHPDDEYKDGLQHPWYGNVWLNPPYGADAGESAAGSWAARLIDQYWSGHTEAAILLVNAVTDRKWFQQLWDFPICFTDHRIRFYTSQGTPQQPVNGNAFVYLGRDVDRFIREFSQFGTVVRRVEA